MRSSRFNVGSLTENLISSFSLGGSKKVQFLGGTLTLINLSFSSLERPFFKISSSRTQILFEIAGAN